MRNARRPRDVYIGLPSKTNDVFILDVTCHGPFLGMIANEEAIVVIVVCWGSHV
jgi:hypothetical protein